MRGRGQTVDQFLMRDSPRESGGRPRFHAVTAPRLLVAVGERLPSIHYCPPEWTLQALSTFSHHQRFWATIECFLPTPNVKLIFFDVLV